MQIVRMFRSGVMLAGLACFAVSMLPGCGDEVPPSGAVVKSDPVADKERADKIRKLYQANPPSKGAGGPVPSESKPKAPAGEAPAAKAETK